MVLQGTGPDQEDRGHVAYLQTCAMCHGMEAEGYANDLAAPACGQDYGVLAQIQQE